MHSPQQDDPTRHKGKKPEESNQTPQISFISAVGLLIKVSWQLRTRMQFEPHVKRGEEGEYVTAHSVFKNKNLVTKRKFREVVFDARLTHIEHVLMECPVERLLSCVKTMKASGWYRRNKEESDGVIVRSLDARLAMVSHSNDSHTLPQMFRIFSARCQCDAKISDSLFSNILGTNIDGVNAGVFFVLSGVARVLRHFKNYRCSPSFNEDCNVLSSILSSYLRHELVPVDGFKEKSFGMFTQSLSKYYLSQSPVYFKDAAPGLKLHVLYGFYDRGLECNIPSIKDTIAKFFSKSLVCWLGEYYLKGDSTKSFRSTLEIAIKAGIKDEISGYHIKDAFYLALLNTHQSHDITKPFSSAMGVFASSSAINADEAEIVSDILSRNVRKNASSDVFFSAHLATSAFCVEARNELSRRNYNNSGMPNIELFLGELITRIGSIKGFSLIRETLESDRLITKIFNDYSLQLLKVKHDVPNPLDVVHADIRLVRERLESLFGIDVFTRKDWWSKGSDGTTYKDLIDAKSNLLRSYRLCVARMIEEKDGNLGIEERDFLKEGEALMKDIKRSLSSYLEEAEDE